MECLLSWLEPPCGSEPALRSQLTSPTHRLGPDITHRDTAAIGGLRIQRCSQNLCRGHAQTVQLCPLPITYKEVALPNTFWDLAGLSQACAKAAGTLREAFQPNYFF